VLDAVAVGAAAVGRLGLAGLVQHPGRQGLDVADDQYAAGGIRRLVSVVERRSREPGASLYLVTTPAGSSTSRPTRRRKPPGRVKMRTIARCSTRSPSVLRYAAGGIRRLVSVVERRSREPGASLYLVTTPAGEHVVGLDVAADEEAEAPRQGEDAHDRPVLDAVAVGAAAVGLGFLGSWFIAQRVLKRVDHMTEITRSIMAGDLEPCCAGG
jgi:hypothetical protein